mmetsp:Transcript_70224/g.117174  ORF Transcript_70224/g.117174 Transcript_70224/m.117174 type:complete len:281 (+) Transcript_70224:953-1795(+)
MKTKFLSGGNFGVCLCLLATGDMRYQSGISLSVSTCIWCISSITSRCGSCFLDRHLFSDSIHKDCICICFCFCFCRCSCDRPISGLCGTRSLHRHLVHCICLPLRFLFLSWHRSRFFCIPLRHVPGGLLCRGRFCSSSCCCSSLCSSCCGCLFCRCLFRGCLRCCCLCRCLCRCLFCCSLLCCCLLCCCLGSHLCFHSLSLFLLLSFSLLLLSCCLCPLCSLCSSSFFCCCLLLLTNSCFSLLFFALGLLLCLTLGLFFLFAVQLLGGSFEAFKVRLLGL